MILHNIKRATGAVSRLVITLIIIVSWGCAPKNVTPPPMDVNFVPQQGDFINSQGERMALEQVAELVADADYVLVGEGHKVACDHNVQQRLLQLMATSERPPAVGLEMVAVDKQCVLDSFADGSMGVDELEAELEWKTRWGYPYFLFKGLFEIVRQNSLPVHGLNVPHSVVKQVSAGGLEGVAEEDRVYLPKSLTLPDEEQLSMLTTILSAHSGMSADNATRVERFVLVQSLWDSKMAEEAVAVRQKYDWPVFIVAGDGHVEFGWGIEKRIRELDPNARIVSFSPWRGGTYNADIADASFFCPPTYESRMGMTLVVMNGEIMVESVARGGRADLSGLRPGDVLVSAVELPLSGLQDLHLAGKKAHDENKPLTFSVRRKGQLVSVNVGLLGKPASKAGAAESGMKQ